MAAPSQTSNAVIIERLGTIREEQAVMKVSVDGIEKSLVDLVVEYRTEHERLVAMANAAHNRIDTNQQRITALEARVEDMVKAIQPLIYSNRILTFVATAFMLSIIGLIWGLVTGSVQIVTP